MNSIGASPGRSGRCGHLIRINPDNGSFVQHCGAFQIDVFQGMRLTDFTFQPGTDRLFGLDTNGGLYTVQDPCLGAAEPGLEVFVGSTGMNRGGLAFRSDGRLFLASLSGQFAEIDPVDGSVIGKVLAMENGIEGLAFRPTDDVLFGTGDDARQIYTIDVENGAQTLLVDNNGVYTAGLAFTPLLQLYYPEWGNGTVKGATLVSDVVIFNTSATQSAFGSVEFWGAKGMDLDEGPILTAVDGHFPAGVNGGDFNLPPLGSATFRTTGLGDLVEGSATISSFQTVTGVVRFEVGLPDGSSITGVGSANPETAVSLPVRREGSLNTGVAIRNTGPSPVTVELTLTRIHHIGPQDCLSESV